MNKNIMAKEKYDVIIEHPLTDQAIASCNPSTNESSDCDRDEMIGRRKENPTSDRDQRDLMSTISIYHFNCKICQKARSFVKR